MNKLNVGFIGLGRIADVHFAGYKGNKKARLYAVCDNDSDLRIKRKKEWKAVKEYADYHDMLSDPDLDAVEILTPQKLHEEMVIEAARAGKHIALQKPMTIDLKSADRMLRETEKAGVVFKVTENYIFYPPIVKARQLIDSGAIGVPTNVNIKFIGGGSGGWDVPPSSWEWRVKELEEGRGMQTFDHGHHLYSTAWYLMGNVERVAAWIDSVDGIIDSPAVMMLKFADKTAYGIIEYAQAAEMHIPSKYYANDEWIEIKGTGGIIKVNRCTGNVHAGPPVSLFNGKKWQHFPSIKSDWVEGFKGAAMNFIDAVRGEGDSALSGREGREILKMALAVSRSSRERREVFLDEMDAVFPRMHSLRKKRRQKRLQKGPGRIASAFRARLSETQYAGRARELTEELKERFNADAAKGWHCVIGLHISSEGDCGELLYSIRIKDGGAVFTEGALPEDAVLTMTVPAGTWAAILLKKKKIEMAFMQGRIKFEGQIEEGLRLRSVFGL